MGIWIRGGSYSWGKYHYFVDETIDKTEHSIPDKYGRTSFTETTKGTSLCNRRSQVMGNYFLRDGELISYYGIRFVKAVNLMEGKSLCTACVKKYLNQIEPGLKTKYDSTKTQLDDVRAQLETLLKDTVITGI